MPATVTLLASEVAAAPGGVAFVGVRVRNDGTIVDEFRLDVVGDAAPWAAVDPPSLGLFPGDQGEAQVRFQPPRDPSVRAGAVPFGVRVRSRDDPTASTVEEGVVTVAPFTQVSAVVVPRTATSSGPARTRVRVANQGNAPLVAALSAGDPDEALEVTLERNELPVQPGSQSEARMRVVPRDRFLRGPARTRPYTVTAAVAGAPPVQADAVLEQRSIIGSGWGKALGTIAALVLGALAIRTMQQANSRGGAPTPLPGATPVSAGSAAPASGAGGGGASTTPAASASMAPSPSPKDFRVVFASIPVGGIVAPKTTLVSSRADGSDERRISALDTVAIDPAVSADGAQLAYSQSLAGGQEVVMAGDTGGANATQVTAGPSDVNPGWSPDGRTIAFSRNGALFTVDVATKRETPLPATPGVLDEHPAFSPDGRTLAYTQTTNGTSQVRLMKLSDKTSRALTTAGGREPAWSPDGRTLAFVNDADRSGEPELWIGDVASGKVTRVADVRGTERSPSWTPNGRILLEVFDGKQSDLWSVPGSAGGTPQRVTDTPQVNEQHPTAAVQS